MGAIIPGMGGGGGAQAPSLYQSFTPQQVNQSYGNTQNSLTQQQALIDALKQQNGTQNQSQVYNQLQNVAQGTGGPDPAQAMLNNSTGQNVANQAALAAGQRGASANAGLIARQAGQIGANTQQQAVGQGAALKQQNAMNALGQAGQMANQQVSNHLNANQQYSNSALQGQQNLLGAVGAHNTAQNQQYAANLQNQQSQAGNAMNGIGGILNHAGPILSQGADAIGGLFSGIGAGAAAALPAIGGAAEAIAPYAALAANGGMIQAPGPRSHMGKYAHGGAVDKVPALVSPGERYLPPSEVKAVASGQKAPMQAGQSIPGKPAVGGAKNSYANDTVPKQLDVGGVVLPRSVTQSKDSDQKAREFVAAILKQKAMKGKK
jgi:hypothetical protein